MSITRIMGLVVLCSRLKSIKYAEISWIYCAESELEWNKTSFWQSANSEDIFYVRISVVHRRKAEEHRLLSCSGL